MARATNSLPVPLSPVIKAVALLAANCPIILKDVLHRLAAPDDAHVVILRLQQRLVGDDLLHVVRGFEGVEHD